MLALQRLSVLNIEYPMIFKIRNMADGSFTHAGVLEFTAEEGIVYIPNWIMNTIPIKNDDIVEIQNVSLPLGTYVKIQPQHTDFLSITDPKAVLERALTNFSALTIGDKIMFDYNSKTYEIAILDIMPKAEGISVIETDIEVDFAPPVGYVPPEARTTPLEQNKADSENALMKLATKDGITPGVLKPLGVRIGGKRSRKSLSDKNEKSPKLELEPQATLKLAEGQLFLGYPIIPYKPSEDKTRKDEPEPNA